jgi:aspartyl protease family protein
VSRHGVVCRFQGLLEIMGRLISIAVGVLVFGVLAAHLLDGSKVPPAPRAAPAVLAAPVMQPAPAAYSRGVTLRRSDDGHFRTDARIDGRRLELVVDTGASAIALRASDAMRVGVRVMPRDFTINVATANGMTKAALVELGMVDVGGVVVRNVRALVHSDEALGVNLLGMTFLSRVRWSHDHGKLIIEQ